MPRVATHSGSFHADDVFAYAILRFAGPVDLVRSRDEGDWAAADIVFDVGGVYDPAHRRYDHHMRDKPLRTDGAPYSSAGLIWRDYGPAALAVMLAGDDEAIRAKVWRHLDAGLIRDIDLMDNGVGVPMAGHLSALLEAWNPTFLEEEERTEAEAFAAAADMAAALLTRAVARARAAAFAQTGLAEAAARAEHPEIILLERRIPWEDAVFELGLERLLYVVRPAGKAWTCSAVPPERGSFAQRRPLPDAWAGLRDEDLVRITGVADATFCHPARFVCGARSREGALALARLAVRTGA